MEITINHTVKHTIELSGTAVWAIIGVALVFALVAACTLYPMIMPYMAPAEQAEIPAKAPMGFV